MAEARIEMKELRRRQTRTRFFAAAAELIAAKGLEDVSMEEIAQRAGYAKGSAYNYFESKDALITELIIHGLGGMTASLREIVDDGSLGRLERLDAMRSLFRKQIESDRGLMLQIDRFLHVRRNVGERLDPEIRARLSEFVDVMSRFFADGAREGLFAEVEPRRLALLFLQTTVAMEHFATLGLVSRDEAEDERFYRSFRGWLTAAGKA